jgi:hypothetical protein
MNLKVTGCTPENWEIISRIANECEGNRLIKK